MNNASVSGIESFFMPNENNLQMQHKSNVKTFITLVDTTTIVKSFLIADAICGTILIVAFKDQLVRPQRRMLLDCYCKNHLKQYSYLFWLLLSKKLLKIKVVDSFYLLSVPKIFRF